jgi:hypothetical protein
MRASRCILLAVLLAAAAGCKGERGGPDGEVVALEGEATAARGEAEPRALAIGDPVFADDVIRTRAASELAIRIAHNQLTVTLGPGIERRLDATAAWKASGAVGAGLLDREPDDRTAAAGRNSENEAGDDPSAVLEGAEVEAEDKTKTDPGPTDRVVKAGADQGAGDDAEATVDGSSLGVGGSERSGSGGAGGAGPAGGIGARERPAIDIDVDVEGGAGLRAAATAAIRRLASRLERCNPGNVVARFDVDDAGAVRAINVEAPPPVRGCVAGVLRSLRIARPGEAGRVTIRLRRR